jgi:ketosteroid isomerase-like protein
MANTLETGKKLVELCRQGKYLDAVDTLYSKDIVSIEAKGDAAMPARTQGIEAIRGKNKWWMENHEIHGNEVKGPFPHGDRFVAVMKMDVTPKAGPHAGKRMQFEEAALYTVRDGKIVREEFFYDMGGDAGA